MTDQTSESSKNVLNETSRFAVCLCTDRNMLIPALFVADAVRRYAAASPHRFDVIVFAQPSELDDVHRRWMEQRGILACDDLDLSSQRGVGKFSGRRGPENKIGDIDDAGHHDESPSLSLPESRAASR